MLGQRCQSRLRWRAIKSWVCAFKLFDNILQSKRRISWIENFLLGDVEEWSEAQCESSSVLTATQQSMSISASAATGSIQQEDDLACVSSVHREESGCSELVNYLPPGSQSYSNFAVQDDEDMSIFADAMEFTQFGDAHGGLQVTTQMNYPTSFDSYKVDSPMFGIMDDSQPEWSYSTFLCEPQSPFIAGGSCSSSSQPRWVPANQYSWSAELSMQRRPPEIYYDAPPCDEVATNVEFCPSYADPDMRSVFQCTLQQSKWRTGPRRSVFFRLVCAIKLYLGLMKGRPQIEASEASVPSRFKGIRRRKGKWVTEIRVTTQEDSTGRKIWLGSYNTQIEAARAFDAGRFYCSNSSKRGRGYNFPDSPRILPARQDLNDLPPDEKKRKLLKRVEHYAKFGYANTD